MKSLRPLAQSIETYTFTLTRARTRHSTILQQQTNINTNIITPSIAAGVGASKRSFSTSKMIQDPFKPAARVAGQRQDVWSIINEAAERSTVKPMVNMGQGFFGYNVSINSYLGIKVMGWVGVKGWWWAC